LQITLLLVFDSTSGKIAKLEAAVNKVHAGLENMQKLPNMQRSENRILGDRIGFLEKFIDNSKSRRSEFISPLLEMRYLNAVRNTQINPRGHRWSDRLQHFFAFVSSAGMY
jgi:hypothetical protein